MAVPVMEVDGHGTGGAASSRHQGCRFLVGALISIVLGIAGMGDATAATTTADLPDLVADHVQDPLLHSIVTEVAALHPKSFLAGTSPDEALGRFGFVSVGGAATEQTVAVDGQLFQHADHIVTARKPQEWQTLLQWFIPRPALSVGDVIYVTATVRFISAQDGKGEGVGRLYASIEAPQGGQSLWAGDFPIRRGWHRVHMAMTVGSPVAPQGSLKLMFTFGQTDQVVEIGGIAALRFPPGTPLAKLPHTRLHLDYEGRAPDAPWRVAALARIDRIRTGPFWIHVVDATGHPLPGAAVHIVMTRHAFTFGTSAPLGMLPGTQVKPWGEDFKRTAGASAADKQHLQEILLTHFNAVTMGLPWVIWEGGDARISQAGIMAGFRWLRDHHLPITHMQVVYPSPEFTPAADRALMDKAHAAAFGAAVDGAIRTYARTFAGYADSFEIANELEGRPQYTDILGKDAVIHWFDVAQQANPSIRRMINAAGELSWSDPASESDRYYYALISWLKKAGAPLQYFGIQNHVGIGAASPIDVLKRLDWYATLGLPIEITEFEQVLQDGSDPRQRAYQGDYLRDFLIAIFSHPAVLGFTLQDFWQPAAWQASGASSFWNADWSINPNGAAFEDLVLHRWWTRVDAKTDADGTCMTRGFLGDYRITVGMGSVRTTASATLVRSGTSVTVVLPTTAAATVPAH